MLNIKTREGEREDAREGRASVFCSDECWLLKTAVKSLGYSSGNSLRKSNSELKALQTESLSF